MTNHSDALKFAQDATVYLHAPAKEDVDNLKAAYLELREGAADNKWDWVALAQQAQEIVQGKPTWKRFIDGTPLSNDVAVWMADFALDITSNLQAAYTAAHSELERAVADLAACREVADGLRKDAERYRLARTLPGNEKLAQFLEDVCGEPDSPEAFDAAIDAAIKEQSHE